MNYAVRFLFGSVPRPRSGAVFLAVALGIFVSGCSRSQATTATPVPEVEVATVETRDVPVYSEWVATLDGYVNAQIRPQVSGYIVRQNYIEGSLVREGQVLFEIDPRPFQATLDRAKGDLAQSQAQLGKATLDVERDTPLAEARAIAKSQLDNDVQAKLGAQAAVEGTERRPGRRRNGHRRAGDRRMDGGVKIHRMKRRRRRRTKPATNVRLE